MSDLISKSALKDKAWSVSYEDEWHMTKTEQVVSVEDIEAAPTIDAVPVGAYEQTRWERDTAIEQLAEIGKSLCEKMDDVAKVVRCKDCKSRDKESGFCYGRGCPAQLVPDDGFCDKGARMDG